MAPLPLRIKIRPQTLNSVYPLRPSSSSSSSSSSSPPFPDQNPNAENSENAPPSQSPTSSLFSDIKERLRSPQASPRRIPTDPPPPPIAAQSPSPAASLDEIRKHLAEFRLRSSPNSNPNPNPTPGPSQDRPISFQELFKNSALKGNKPQDPNSRLSYDSIRESLRQGRSPVRDTPKFMSQFGSKLNATTGPSLIGDQENLPESIFGREMREKMGEKEGDGEGKELKTEFVKMYSYDELGEKLRRLRPEAVEKGGKDWFSLEELNLRLAKLRELEEKETESRVGGVSFSDLRKSLMRLKDAETSKKASMQRMSILTNLNISTTPSFMLRPPQDNLLENYFHPDHMSSAEKMKLELKKVRDEFKMSESDCGSARVQIAQLTARIKHLSSVLHKKDKHSRKGINEMVQRRKKLLKYLRRTDWDSYCFVLSKLGLRDVPEYKVPDYKC